MSSAGRAATKSEDLNFTELGAFLGLSRETARRLCIKGKKIPYKQLSPRCFKVTRADAEKYKRSVTTPSE